MTYKIVHRTTYRYKYPVSFGNHVACLRPRTLFDRQEGSSEIVIAPHPATVIERADYFGNSLCFFTIQEPHRELIVESRSQISVRPAAASTLPSVPWEDAAQPVSAADDPAALEALQYRFESPRIKLLPEYRVYALASFTPRRALGDALVDLTDRIYRDFKFDAKATTVRTPTEHAFKRRRGVCQDFAHIQIACLRSLNLCARYVSGYLRTYPPPGRPRLIGADASHAWVSAYCPGFGWLDLDPTNNLIPSDGHVTIAWGRDYSDVSPLRGIILGGGDHRLKVSVDMEPVE